MTAPTQSRDTDTCVYECIECGARTEAEHQPGRCDECGGHMQNISVSRCE